MITLNKINYILFFSFAVSIRSPSMQSMLSSIFESGIIYLFFLIGIVTIFELLTLLPSFSLFRQSFERIKKNKLFPIIIADLFLNLMLSKVLTNLLSTYIIFFDKLVRKKPLVLILFTYHCIIFQTGSFLFLFQHQSF